MIVAVGVAAVLALGAWAAGMAWFQVAGPGEPLESGPTAGGQIEVFTFVETGIVYVDPETSEIIWQDQEQARRTIGERPWRNPEPTDERVPAVRPWQNEHRDIVGNPDHNVVSWVETVDGRRGDMVVIEADTGEELARAPLDEPEDDSIVLASVDDEAVYYAVVDRNWPFPDVRYDATRMWRWAAGENPEAGPLAAPAYLNDLSAGVTAFYREPGILFDHADGEWVTGPATLAQTDFGGALSPDGRFWYGAKSSQIVDTATGKAVEINTGVERAYGWTGAAELALIICEEGTGVCQTVRCDFERADGRFCDPDRLSRKQPEGGPFGVCAAYGVPCRANMPTS